MMKFALGALAYLAVVSATRSPFEATNTVEQVVTYPTYPQPGVVYPQPGSYYPQQPQFPSCPFGTKLYYTVLSNGQYRFKCYIQQVQPTAPLANPLIGVYYTGSQQTQALAPTLGSGVYNYAIPL